MAMVRTGEVSAYRPLYERHFAVARARARRLVPDRPAEADEVVSEGFLRLLEALLDGGGPTRSFRAYLLTTITHAALARKRRLAQELLTDDPTANEAASRLDPRPQQETAVERVLERSLVVRAFDRLPATARQVLLYTEVMGMSPADAARVLDISPNAVSSRAHRAREALRAAYLDAHVIRELVPSGCAHVVDDLGSWARRALRPRRRSAVDDHLGKCANCRKLADELASLNTCPREAQR